MPSLHWLRTEFADGYSSGNILSWLPDRRRRAEERSIGGSYRQFFRRLVAPRLNPDAHVCELGPGRGSWTRAILRHTPAGEVHTFDYQDVSRWLLPERYGGRLICHHVEDNRFADVPDRSFDLFFSFGVLCHHQEDQLRPVLLNALPKMKVGGLAIHQYGDWDKLDQLGWPAWSEVPRAFRELPDSEIWWPRNSAMKMASLCAQLGWTVLEADLGCFARDSVILLRRDSDDVIRHQC